jgi:energy-coupling factor transport system permease protein
MTVGLFEFYEADSPLHRRNPFVKLVALGIVMLVVTIDLKPSTPWFDPGVPLVFLVLVVAGLTVFGRVPLWFIVRRLVLLALLTLPFLLFNAIYFDAAQVASPTLLFSFGPWTAYREGLIGGLALAVRILTFLSCSMAFVMTTDPSDFAISLIRQARVPYRFGYAILVSYRFLPIMRTEFDTIRAAHRIRGVGERTGLRGRLQQLRRYAVPLLAAAIRKSERTATAMDSRGFGGGPERTYYRQTRVTAFDWSFLMAVVGITMVLIEALIFVGVVDGVALVPPA